jgi:nicotinamide-nucleotide amidase
MAPNPVPLDFDVSDRAVLLLSLTLGHAAQRRGIWLGLVESCTGGLAASWVTQVWGSSAWFEGGVVTYSNAMKELLVAVSPEALAQHGAVSAPIAAQMAAGFACRLDGLGRKLMVASVTGVAGPAGGTNLKPVGTVWFGWDARGCGPVNPPSRTQLCRFAGDRHRIQRQAAWWALSGLASWLMAQPRETA